jgi:hypothetical protein
LKTTGDIVACRELILAIRHPRLILTPKLMFPPVHMTDPGECGLSSWGTPLTPGTRTRSNRRKNNAGLCRMLASECYDVLPLPVVLVSAGKLFRCLDRATKERTFPMPEARNCTASFFYTGYTVCKAWCPNGRYLERQNPKP